jgi:hypothetical protein
MDTRAKIAFETLKQELQADSEYAWGWHCNIAMASVDEGMDHAAANRAAARFMRNCFGIDTSKSRQYATLKLAPVEWPDVIGGSE